MSSQALRAAWKLWRWERKSRKTYNLFMEHTKSKSYPLLLLASTRFCDVNICKKTRFFHILHSSTSNKRLHSLSWDQQWSPIPEPVSRSLDYLSLVMYASWKQTRLPCSRNTTDQHDGNNADDNLTERDRIRVDRLGSDTLTAGQKRYKEGIRFPCSHPLHLIIWYQRPKSSTKSIILTLLFLFIAQPTKWECLPSSVPWPLLAWSQLCQLSLVCVHKNLQLQVDKANTICSGKVLTVMLLGMPFCQGK